jgi:hypothetical protein
MNRLRVAGIFVAIYQLLLLSALFHPVGWFYKLSAWILSAISIFIFAGIYATRKVPPKPKPIPAPEPAHYEEPTEINQYGRGTRLETVCQISGGYDFWPQVECHVDTIDPLSIDKAIRWLTQARGWLVLKREERIRDGKLAFFHDRTQDIKTMQ